MLGSVADNQCQLPIGNCRHLRTSTLSSPELNASSESYCKSNLTSSIWSACESMGSTDPTILPARKVVLALASDRGPLRPLRGSAFGFGQPDRFATGAFLANHEIAFGVVRLALHLFSQRCVWRWGSVLPTVARARRRHFGASPLRR